MVRRFFPSIRPVSINGPSDLRETRHLDTSDVLHAHYVSCDKRTCYVPCLRLLLTAWAGRVTIDILPDDVLLHIFHFVRVICADSMRFPNYRRRGKNMVRWPPSWWHPIVHVCRNWRSVVFASPRFFDVRLVCNPTTRVELMDVWPPLPIIITNGVYFPLPEDCNFDVAIVHRNRVGKISLHLTSSQLQRLASVMQEPFPALVHLKLKLRKHPSHPAPALPHGFLAESAPRLQSLRLESISFPALPKLLLSTTDLIRLELCYIPHAGYISPEVLITALAVLANLEFLTIEFEFPPSPRDQEGRPPPPLTCITLPALTSFTFKGIGEYMEDLVAHVDAPLLDFIQITFFHQPMFEIPQLAQFMRRTTRLKAPNEARVHLDNVGVWVKFLPQAGAFDKGSVLGISCKVLKWQLSSLAQLLTSFFPSIYMVEQLYIFPTHVLPSRWPDDAENTQWLEFFHPFTAVKDLYVSKEFVRSIAPALQDLVGERVRDVLPDLESLFWGTLQSSQGDIAQFVTARQLLGRPIAVSHWKGQ